MKFGRIYNSVRLFSTEHTVPKVCIIGSGPAGFYAAQQLLKTSSDVKVDILEKLPVPFGLVRFGVAPDHPEVKNVIHTFEKTASNSRFQFIGNVNVGTDVTIQQLQHIYHAVLLAYGAEEDKLLGIPGENLKNVISGRRFVGWYNGVPTDSNLNINLDVEEAVVLGQGNVAIDIARILLTPVDKLKNTDITSYALEKLSQSKVRKVLLVGRRGPLQVAFTIAELREILKLEGCRTYWHEDDFTNVKDVVNTLARPRKRITELMLKYLEETSSNITTNTKELHPIFLRSPVEFLGTDSVAGIKLSINRLEGNDLLTQVARPTGTFENIPCSLVFRSIGYKSIQIDNSIPFDARVGCIKNSAGKVAHKLYAAGWVATGPVGVILSTMTNAFQVGAIMNKELIATENKPGTIGLHEILNKKNIRTVSYNDWKKIDKAECERGKELGKPREKITDVSEMLEIALSICDNKMNLHEPKKKRRVKLKPESPFPISLNDKNEWITYTAHLTDTGSCIIEPTEIAAVHSMGFFGKGSLSRGFPSFGKARYGAPPVIRNRQWVRRQEWLKQFNELSMESNNSKYINSEENKCDLPHFEELDEEDKKISKNLEKENTPDIIEIDTNSISPDKNQSKGHLHHNEDEDDISVITNENSNEQSNNAKSNEKECSENEEKEESYFQEFSFKENSERFANSDTDVHSKLLILPDSDSETESYLKEIKPKIECQSFPVQETLHLTFEETFFLLYGLGCLNVIDFDGNLMDIDTTWHYFCKADKNFVQKYVVYHYFRSKGWVVKPGLKYGGDFLLYKQGPPFYHASYIVIVDVLDGDSLIRDQSKSMHKFTWNNLLGLERLSETAAKEILFAQILWPSTVSQTSSSLNVDVLCEFSVKELLWRRWNPKHNRDMEEEDDDSLTASKIL